MASALESFELDEQSFITLLTKLIGESKHVQNNPPDLIPEEDKPISHVLEVLNPYRVEEGGPLIIKHVSFVKGRGNLIIEYPGKSASSEKEKVVSIVGSHLDVVPANPSEWDFDPFSMSIEGDKLRGRGTTDCLGHVALVTELFRQLAIQKPELQTTVVAVFIANEENSSIEGVGVDELVKTGAMDKLKNGPLFWLDSADTHPCIGTGGMSSWSLKATGKGFHSGLPHKTVNPLELAMESLSEIQKKFYQEFPPHPQEKVYGFVSCSTMKPTNWNAPPGSVNQIPAECTITGDIRVTPFYDVEKVRSTLLSFANDELNSNLSRLSVRGPCSKYEVADENLKGRIELSFTDVAFKGVACDLTSPGFFALRDSTQKVFGKAQPFSITGSLPLVRDLQEAGFDVQIMGYGLSSTYHAKNEYCLLSDMKGGYRVLANVIARLERDAC